MFLFCIVAIFTRRHTQPYRKMKKAEIKKQAMAKANGEVQTRNFGKAVDKADASTLERITNWVKSGDVNKRFWDAVAGKAYGKSKAPKAKAKAPKVKVAEVVKKPEVKPTVLHSKYN